MESGGGGVIEFTDFGEKFSECNTWLKKTVIDKANNTSEKKNIKVSAITLDGFVERKNIPNFIKLDVEGAELFALEGMENILKNYSPLLSVEFWGGKNWMETNDKIFNFLKNFGYQPYSVKEGKLLKYDGKKQFNYANFIFKKE